MTEDQRHYSYFCLIFILHTSTRNVFRNTYTDRLDKIKMQNCCVDISDSSSLHF